MPGCLQFPKRFHTSAELRVSSGVKEAKLLAHGFGQLAPMKKRRGFEQLADVFYAFGVGEGPFDLILCVHFHAATMHDTGDYVQLEFMGKEQS